MIFTPNVNPNLKMLNNDGIIPIDAICYGKMTTGKRGWCGPGSLVGKRWDRYSTKSPSIVLIKRD